VAEFDAFISYSRRASTVLATDLQVAVERFAKPWYRLRAVRVFRDDASMSANPGLWSTIEAALRQAEWLVLLASPPAAQSEYVANEVTWWRENKAADRILIVLEEGVDIAWDRAANDFDFDRTDSLPRALSGAFAEEPRWIDLRWFEAEGSLGTKDPRWEERVADIAAAVRGAERDELIGENVRQHRLARRLLRGGVAALSLLLVASLVATFVAIGQRAEANRQRTEAVKQRDEATAQARIALARQLAAQAVSLAPTDLQTASLLAVQAYRTNADAQTRAALFQLATASPQLVRPLPMDAEVTASAVTEDGVVVVGDVAGDVVRWTDGRAEKLMTVGGKVSSLAVSDDGSVVAAAAPDGVTVWRGGSTTLLTDLVEPTAVTVEASGAAVAASDLFTTALWDLAAGQPGYRGTIEVGGSDLTFAQGFLVMVGASGAWAVARVGPFQVVQTGSHGFAMTVRFVVSADGLVMAGVSETTDYPVWRGDETYSDQYDSSAVAHFGVAGGLGIAVSADGSLVASQGPGYLQVASVQDPTAAARLPTDLGGTGGVSSFNTDALTFGGSRYLVSASGNDALLWDLRQVSRIGSSFAATVPIPCHGCGIGRMAVSPAGSHAVLWGLAAPDDGPVIVDLATQRTMDLDPDLSAQFSALAWLGDDTLVGYRDSDDAVVTTGLDGSPATVVTQVPKKDDSDDVVEIGVADGHALLVLRSGPVVDVDLDTGETTPRGALADDPRIGTAFSWRVAPDGSSVAVLTTEDDGSLVLLVMDPQADRVIAELPALGAAYDATSRLHVFDGHNTSVVENGKVGDSSPSGLVEETPPPVVSPDGEIVVSGGVDGTVSLNDLARQGSRFGSFTVPQHDGVYAVSEFTPDGARLVTAVPVVDGDSSIRLLSLDPKDWIAAACAVAARDLTADDWTRYGVGSAPDDLRCVQ
jgi:WD40 repeat protein